MSMSPLQNTMVPSGHDRRGDHRRDRRVIESAIELMDRLTPDDYTSFLTDYYADGLRRFGSGWRYADVTVLLRLSEGIEPRS